MHRARGLAGLQEGVNRDSFLGAGCGGLARELGLSLGDGALQGCEEMSHTARERLWESCSGARRFVRLRGAVRGQLSLLQAPQGLAWQCRGRRDPTVGLWPQDP